MNTNVLQTTEQTSSENPSGLIAIAVEKNLSIEHIEKLMALKERWDGIQANKAFLTAMSRFQNEVPPIQKKKVVGYVSKTGGTVGYKYAELGEIDEAIKTPMANNGLTKRWEISEDGEKLICTCIISHVDGHTEKTTMSSIKDSSGNKNEIQSRASAVSYLQRYTLIGALGLTTASEDNDGDGTAQAPPVNMHNNNNGTDLPWLNINDKSGKKTTHGIEVINEIASGKTTIEDLSNRFKLSKAVREELANVQVTGQGAVPLKPEVHIATADKKPFEIPGLWYAIIEKWKTITDALQTFSNKKDTINAHPELQQLIFGEMMKLCKSKADVLTVYNAAKDTVNAHPELQVILKQTQNKFSTVNA